MATVPVPIVDHRPAEAAGVDPGPPLRPLSSTRVDSIDWLFGLIPAAMTMLVTVLWGRLLARTIRGVGPKTVPLGTSVASGLAIAAWSFVSGTRAREHIALRQSIVEVRDLSREQAQEAGLRDEREVARDQRDYARNQQLYRINIGLLVLAALTLAAAIATLVVTVA